MVISRSSQLIYLLALMSILMTGCRQVERVTEEGGLPLVAWGRDLYQSEGVLVYATSVRAAREIAGHADTAAEAFRRMSGEEPRQLIYVAVDRDDSVADQMLEAGLQGISRISGKSVPEIKSQMIDSAKKQGGDGVEQEQQMLHALLSLIPGVLEAPVNRPAEVWGDAVVISTSSRIHRNLDIIIDGVMKREEVGTFKRLMWSPIIAIAKGYISRILNEIQETIIIGVHSQGRVGWTQDRIDQMLKNSLKESDLKQLFENGSREIEKTTSKPTRQPLVIP
ncbi:MAG: hypothetical protein OSB09_01135 [Planctomycetota bacterium]|nr:hypothetical protein [Planctomycetota bacterium]